MNKSEPGVEKKTGNYAHVNGLKMYYEIHGSRSKPSEGGLKQVHLFRFGTDNKTVKYWDITQQIQPNMPNSGGAL
jgi:predicted SnoaL-like aldol condensation-catalyzing enzyme